MLEWLWVCMVIAFKAAVGSFLWSLVIGLGSVVVFLIIMALVGVGSMFIKDKKDKK